MLHEPMLICEFCYLVVYDEMIREIEIKHLETFTTICHWLDIQMYEYNPHICLIKLNIDSFWYCIMS